MLNKIKIRIFAVAVMACLLVFLTQTTIAYYTTTGKTTNVVTSGGIKLAIHETTDNGTPFPEEGVYIVPGDVVSKKVNIENVSEHPFYLRVKIVFGIDSQELSADECFKLNIDESNWKLYDGWYYYTGVVEPNEVTPNVFSHVEIVGSKMDNNYLGKTLTLTVKAQAVQSENNPITGGNTHTASGWPIE